MRRILFFLSLLGALGTAQLSASPFSYFQPEGFYISSTASLSIAQDSDARYGNGAASGEIEFNNGLGMTASVGHHFGESWRVELEYAYRSTDIDTLNPRPAAMGNTGSLTSHSLMINALYDVNLNYNFFWYSGGGIGVALTNFKSGSKEDDDMVFAYQLMTGFGYRLSQQTSFVLGYRIFHTLKQDYTINGVNADVDGSWQHIFEMGIRYDF